MAIFDKASKIFTEGAQRINGKSEAGRLGGRITDNERKIRQLYEEIGTWYCDTHSADPDPAVANQVRGIGDMLRQNEAWHDEIQRLNGMTKCPNCGTYVPNNVVFCVTCGARVLAENLVVCANCGGVIDKNSLFCDKCGSRVLNTPVAQAASQAGVVTCRCGTVLGEDIAFCPVCGTSKADLLKEQAPAQSVPVSAPVVPPQVKIPEQKKCPVCGAVLEENDRFCQYCGTPIPDEEEPKQETPTPAEATPSAAHSADTCPACGAAIHAGDKFCETCGSLLTAPGTPEQEESAAEPQEQVQEDSPAPDPDPAFETPEAYGAPQDPNAGLGETVSEPETAPVETPAGDLRRCGNCGAELAEGDAFCTACGFPVSGGTAQPEGPKQNLCPFCGAEVEEGSRFCMECGSKLV